MYTDNHVEIEGYTEHFLLNEILHMLTHVNQHMYMYIHMLYYREGMKNVKWQ